MVRARGSLRPTHIAGRERLTGRALTHEKILERTGALFEGPRPRAPFTGLRVDDRSREGDLFVAIRGDRYDGHRRLENLPARHPEAPGWGLRGVVGELEQSGSVAFPYYRVESSRQALGELEQLLNGDPGTSLETVGVTGTNGKSTTVRLLAAILEAAERRVGWMGTVSSRTGGSEVASTLTTPEARTLARGMADLVAAGGDSLVLEVSSHALVQKRVAGVNFAGGILTNLGRDHLDYHGTREAYLEAKLDLFRRCTDGAPVVVPLDGPVPDGHRALRDRRVLTFSESGRADATAGDVVLRGSGMVGRLHVLGQTVDFRSPLVGRHNLRNILAAALLARAIGVTPEAIGRGLAESPPVAGRLQPVGEGTSRIYVDYAHTPDALEAVLEAVRELTPGRLFAVFGCGGDRDRGKRPEMGRIAAHLADRVYVTSDNPRTEDPAHIIQDVLEGIGAEEDVVVECDRALAIGRAVRELGSQDVLLVAGKGHERDQLIGNRKLPFDDCEVIRRYLDGEAPS